MSLEERPGRFGARRHLVRRRRLLSRKARYLPALCGAEVLADATAHPTERPCRRCVQQLVARLPAFVAEEERRSTATTAGGSR